MIHFRLDGGGVSTGQASSVSILPYNDDETPDSSPLSNANAPPNDALPIMPIAGKAVIPGGTPNPSQTDYIELENLSTAGQTCYFVTDANTISTTNFEFLLYPGESVELSSTELNIYGAADAANSILSRRWFRRLL